MNKIEENQNNIITNNPKKELDINENIFVEENNYINIKYDIHEIKRIIEDKVDLYMMKEYIGLFNSFEEKINNLLLIQEKLFIKNEIMRQKIKHLENYLKSYSKKK